jgi:multimeric flavodoxin WrbA
MRITAFNGSPRKDRGNTHWMVTEFLAGAQEAGAEVENVFVCDKDIRPCTSCYGCWTTTPGQCVQTDDMADLLSKFLGSDTVVFASPVYVDNVTGPMKMFMDRLIPVADPHMEPDPAGETRHRRRHERPANMVAISNCGYPEQSHFQVLRLLYRRMARNFHCELVAEVYRGGGGLLTAPIPDLRPAVETYRRLLREAGREVVTAGKLSEQTAARLEAPLVPMQADVGQYIDCVNQMWDVRIAPARR